MRVGILAAMEEEIGLVKRAIKKRKVEKALQTGFYTGVWHQQPIVLARSGLGKVNAAAVTQRMISVYKPEIIIMVGVAGACNADLSIGDVIIVDEVVHWDLDVTGLGFELGELPFMGIKIMEAHQKLVSMAHQILKRTRLKVIAKNKPKVFVGRIASGDTFVTDEERVQLIVEKFNNLCVDMESAAVAQVCFLNKTPFAIIKSVSDKADEKAEIDFAKFLKIAAGNSFLVLEKFIKEISKQK
jgi:adenosylhomocysteine nucleosidase